LPFSKSPVTVLLLSAFAAPPGVLAAAPPDFARDVQPIFAQRCQGCHGAKMQMAGLRLDQGRAALGGSASGPVIVPGKAAESRLIQRVTSDKASFRMPPSGEGLPAGQIAVLKAWIDAGAVWPGAEGPAVKPPAGAAAISSTHWSFQPIAHPQPPAVKNTEWVRNPIDAFILAKLEGQGIGPSPEASKAALLRRVSLDLTGLPPTPEEAREFVGDASADAYDRVVDRLLASPHYGEKWARHWLDLARYADSDGYEKDLQRANAWRYRQWVIDALNADMPFDRFTIEQLAGDLLPNATVEQRVATGFQRCTLTNREAGVDRAETRFEQVVNRTNTTATVWLGLTIGCAQCHNHKFDPLTQRDHYRLEAFWNVADEGVIDAPLDGEWGGYLRALPEHRREVDAALRQFCVPERMPQWIEKMRTAFREPGKDIEWDFQITSFRAMFDGADKFLRGDPEGDDPRLRARLVRYYIGSPGPQTDDITREDYRRLRELLTGIDAKLPRISQADVLTAMARPPKTYIHLGGDYKALGAEVGPGVPAVLPQIAAANPTRLDLARWLVSRGNPLTARVAVNRMWQELFGRGLVRTSEDFGTQGDAPTHPELLDWLSADFMDHGWGMKRMHRMMVMSAAYRQSSGARPDLEARDPENTLVARQGRLRLPAELVRDEALAAAGLLNPAVGGRSVRPPQPKGVAELGYAGSVKWNEDSGAERYRRGLYVFFQRTTPYPMLMNFDMPDSNVTCSRRRRSNTPLQALNLLNDPVFHEAAQGLAVRLYRELPQGGFDERLDRAYLLALGRTPTAKERERLRQYHQQQAGILRSEKSAAEILPFAPDGADGVEAGAWVGVARVLMNLDEFVNRE
jgi:hypothetical protein